MMRAEPPARRTGVAGRLRATPVAGVGIAVLLALFALFPVALAGRPSAQEPAGSLPPVAEPARDASGAVAYRVDPSRSRAGFTMKATLHTVHGTTSAVTGEFTRPASPGPEGFPVTGRIAIASDGLETGNGSRDKRMKSEILDVGLFPEILFVPRAAEGKVGSFAPGSRAKFELQGDLTIHGTTRPVTISVTALFTEGGIVADGTTAFSFLDFGVPDPSNFFLHVNPDLTVTFHIEASARP